MVNDTVLDIDDDASFLDDGAIKIIGLISAGTGAIPLVLATYFSECVIVVASAAVTLSGLFRANMDMTSNSTHAAVEIVDGTIAVLFTLVICVRIGTHRTFVGVLRMLWVVVIVTSSSSYVSIRKLAPPDFSIIPTDLTIIALGVSCLLLLGTYIVSRCYRSQAIRDARIIVVESTLVLGSFGLRFDEDVARIVGVAVGWFVWYIACHSASLFALYIVRSPRLEDGGMQDGGMNARL